MNARLARVGGAPLFWEMVWRGVVWHVGIGSGLGGLYGCSFVVAALMMPTSSEESWVWIVRAVVLGCAFAGAVGGWVLGRLMGLVVGTLVGMTLGGVPFAFYYLFAFPTGVIFGAVYGLAVGVVNAVVAVWVTQTRFHPTFRPDLHRRALAWAGMLGVLVLPLPWLAPLGAGPPVEVVSSGLTGSPTVDFLVYVVFPLLILLPFTRWVGARLAAWYAGASLPTDGSPSAEVGADSMEPVRNPGSKGGA